MTDPGAPGGENSPFVGPNAWPPSLVARKPSLALPIMGGLAVATLLTLVFLPALYVTWYRVKAPAKEPQEAEPVA